MSENFGKGESSSQESLPLSQETYNTLWHMMNESGRSEMLAAIDVGYLDSSESWPEASAPHGAHVPPSRSESWPEASSPHGAHVPPSRSSLPATCSWPGVYNFRLLFAHQEKVNKHITWAYSEVENKLYVRKDALCPFSFQTNTVMPDNVFVRAMAVYSSPEHASSVVTRCVNHSQQEHMQGLFEAEHLIRSESQLASYQINRETKRHSVVVPFENPPVGQDYSTYIFKFACFSSCAGGPNRRALTLIFTLEQGNNELGRIVLDLKICACPGRDSGGSGRDRVSGEKEKLPQLTTSGPVSKKMKADVSCPLTPQNYFENLPKKKKLEGKPENKQEYIIKVKDLECFNFLMSMKKLFLGNRRFGRLSPECRTLLRIYKSSSDEEERS